MSSGQSHRKPSGWVCHRNLGSFSRAFQLALESLSGQGLAGGIEQGWEMAQVMRYLLGKLEG